MKLPRDFYERATLDVARELVGKVLVRRLGRRKLAGRIVETEAYVGADDLACHASRCRTPRTATMFGPAGVAYVYMIYGFYYCLNAVTEAEGYPAAVLLRAIEPLNNIETMRGLRKNPPRDLDIASGPGKLCMALGIGKSLNGADLIGSSLWIEDRGFRPESIGAGPRVGVDYAGAYRDKPWRFFEAGNPHVSKGAGKRGQTSISP
jgi:DNA-3-methyladenine glycosylase